MATVILLIIFSVVVLIGGYFYLKDDRPFDYSDIADIIEAEAYLESIRKNKK